MNNTPVTGETKPWYLSKTIIGTAITGVAIVGGFLGVDLDDETKKLVVDQTEALVVAGAALADGGAGPHRRDADGLIPMAARAGTMIAWPCCGTPNECSARAKQILAEGIPPAVRSTDFLPRG